MKVWLDTCLLVIVSYYSWSLIGGDALQSSSLTVVIQTAKHRTCLVVCMRLSHQGFNARQTDLHSSKYADIRF